MLGMFIKLKGKITNKRFSGGVWGNRWDSRSVLRRISLWSGYSRDMQSFLWCALRTLLLTSHLPSREYSVFTYCLTTGDKLKSAWLSCSCFSINTRFPHDCCTLNKSSADNCTFSILWEIATGWISFPMQQITSFSNSDQRSRCCCNLAFNYFTKKAYYVLRIRSLDR